MFLFCLKVTEQKRIEHVERLERTRRELTGQHEEQLQSELDKLRSELNRQLHESRKPLQEMYEKKVRLDPNAFLRCFLVQLANVSDRRARWGAGQEPEECAGRHPAAAECLLDAETTGTGQEFAH